MQNPPNPTNNISIVFHHQRQSRHLNITDNLDDLNVTGGVGRVLYDGYHCNRNY